MSLYIPTFSEICNVAREHGQNSDAPDLWRRLIGDWPLQEPGGLTAFDVSGYGRHGTLTNMDPATDRVVTEKGRALDFDAIYDEVILPTTMNLGTTYSLALWWKIPDVLVGRTMFGDSARETRYGWYIDATNFYHSAYDTAQRYVSVAHGGTATFLGKWCHFAVVRSETSVSFYLNAKQIGTTQTLSANAIQYYNLFSRVGPFAGDLKGSVIVPAIWMRPLTVSEIAQLCTRPWDRYTQRRKVFATAVAGGTSSTIDLPVMALTI